MLRPGWWSQDDTLAEAQIGHAACISAAGAATVAVRGMRGGSRNALDTQPVVVPVVEGENPKDQGEDDQMRADSDEAALPPVEARGMYSSHLSSALRMTRTAAYVKARELMRTQGEPLRGMLRE